MPTTDIAGLKFGRLTVLAFAGYVPSGKERRPAWLCSCDCGTSSTVRTVNLLSGNTKSCGCLRREKTAERFASHGHTRAGAWSREYRTWGAMVARCINPMHSRWKHYGARGIVVCDRWRYGDGNMSGFLCFIADMPPHPGKRFSLDRIDNDGPYSPDNCRWATPKQQRRNTRFIRLLTYNGETLCLQDWCERLRVNRGTVHSRLRLGWSIEDALTRPPQPGRPHSARLAA